MKDLHKCSEELTGNCECGRVSKSFDTQPLLQEPEHAVGGQSKFYLSCSSVKNQDATVVDSPGLAGTAAERFIRFRMLCSRQTSRLMLLSRGSRLLAPDAEQMDCERESP
jgi:hypothetical protein